MNLLCTKIEGVFRICKLNAEIIAIKFDIYKKKEENDKGYRRNKKFLLEFQMSWKICDLLFWQLANCGFV